MIERLLHPWRGGQIWARLSHVVLDLPVGLALFVPTIVLLALTLGLAITVLIALFPLTGLLVWTALAGRIERSRAAALLDVHVSNPVPPLPKGSPWRRLRAAATEPARWRQVAYCLLRFPLSLVLFTVVIASWSTSFAMLALPAYVSALPDDTAQLGLMGITQGPATFLAAAAGAMGLVLLAPWLTYVAAHIDAGLIRWLLGPPADAALTERAEKAESGRAAAIGAAETERRRIERDLHDGAQQRLVALAMDLGSARERLETDPEGGKALVAEAHEEAKAALREIRDLVRGIHPVILEDRGLDAALSAVVARSPIPVHLTVELAERPPELVESAAYFVVSEALTNIARHSEARQAHVGVVRSGDKLIVEVRDDGIGGADADRGTGLSGLSDRVRALGGTMDVLSPVGGPTTVLVELPCAS